MHAGAQVRITCWWSAARNCWLRARMDCAASVRARLGAGASVAAAVVAAIVVGRGASAWRFRPAGAGHATRDG